MSKKRIRTFHILVASPFPRPLNTSMLTSRNDSPVNGNSNTHLQDTTPMAASTLPRGFLDACSESHRQHSSCAQDNLAAAGRTSRHSFTKLEVSVEQGIVRLEFIRQKSLDRSAQFLAELDSALQRERSRASSPPLLQPSPDRRHSHHSLIGNPHGSRRRVGRLSRSYSLEGDGRPSAQAATRAGTVSALRLPHV